MISKKVMSNFNIFCLRMLNRIFRNLDDTGIVTIYGEMFLTNTIIKKKFLHLKELSVATTNNNVFCLNSGGRDEIFLFTHP